MSKFARKMIRVACYVRVSTEEQKKGDSVDNQIVTLQEYVDNHKECVLVDFYIDNGVSSVKLKKRLQLQRLLQDVRDGKIDMVLFTRLDRWGRSVQYYYQLQDVLDQHNVSWKATNEEYETETANGKFTVNVMMSIAQHERDKDSERIKEVFVNKVKNGEPLYGSHILPFGFQVSEINGRKAVVHNKEEEPILHDILNHYYTFKSKRKTTQYLYEKYGVDLHYESVCKLLKNTLLYGSYRGNDNYCEPYITKERFDELQYFSKKNVRVRKTNYTYIFSGLLVCPHCGSHLVGSTTYNINKNGEKKILYTYRCENAFRPVKSCDFRRSRVEPKVEESFLENLRPFLEEYIWDCELKAKKQPTKKVDIKKLESELDRLNKMYQKDRISEEVYDRQYEEINNRIKEAKNEIQPKQASAQAKKLMDIDIIELYKTFTKEEKQAFVSGVVKDICIDEEYHVTRIIFL